MDGPDIICESKDKRDFLWPLVSSKRVVASLRLTYGGEGSEARNFNSCEGTFVKSRPTPVAAAAVPAVIRTAV